jgi:2-polyprenyl-3-methyl-5-hydroxy-6-metoxy-1,4-benzoquinol methylase
LVGSQRKNSKLETHKDYHYPIMTNNTSSIPGIHFESLARLEASYWWHQSRLNWSRKIIRANFREPSSLNVLDYGCGTGGFLHQLNSIMKFKSCLGVDVAQEAIKRALNHPENYQKIDPFDLSMIPGKDLVCLMDTLEHIEADKYFLNNLISRMDIGANLLISVPAFSCLFSAWDKTLGHYRRYEKKDLSKLVSDAGGSILFIEYTFSYLFPALIVKRIIGKAQYDSDNCEFPSVSSLLNNFLLKLNRLEMFSSNYFSPPLGSSLFCLIKKPL